MDLHRLKIDLQSFVGEGLALIIGSGLSVAEGLPGMGDLAGHLIAEVPRNIGPDDLSAWEPIGAALAGGRGLEETLFEHTPTAGLEIAISRLCAEFIANREAPVLDEVIANGRILRLSRLLGRCLRPDSGIPIITTNYDRLAEVAAIDAGLGIDCLFFGDPVGRLDVQLSRFAHCRGVRQRGRHVQLSFSERALILKPHGSLDWYETPRGPVRCAFPLVGAPLVIAPGRQKYRAGYDSPFDVHREVANMKLDRAIRYMIIGYGFNDDHLHSHLIPHLQRGRPALLLTRTLSESAKALLPQCSGLTCLSRPPSPSGPGTLYSCGSVEHTLNGVEWWDLGNFSTEVLGA